MPKPKSTRPKPRPKSNAHKPKKNPKRRPKRRHNLSNKRRCTTVPRRPDGPAPGQPLSRHEKLKRQLQMPALLPPFATSTNANAGSLEGKAPQEQNKGKDDKQEEKEEKQEKVQIKQEDGATPSTEDLVRQTCEALLQQLQLSITPPIL